MDFPRKPWKLSAADKRFLRSLRITAEDGRMTGARIPGDVLVHTLKPGEYGRDANGDWYGATPNGLIANLRQHRIQEHHDGTITVEPSIYVNRGRDPEWHGFLVQGTWSQC